jgi:deoxyribodipyrimidine photo-lyase
MANVLFWFRRDLRLNDNVALFNALKSGNSVIPIFIFDKNILDDLEDKQDRRVTFIHQTITTINADLQKIGSSLLVKYGDPFTEIQKLISEFGITNIYTNHDYEPYAKHRDAAITTLLAAKNGALLTYKDQVIFEKSEVVKDDGLPYTVFTPYSKKWKAKLTEQDLQCYDCKSICQNFSTSHTNLQMPSLADMNFTHTSTNFPSIIAEDSIIKNYHETRDFPSVIGTTKMSIHLRFGTISIRAIAKQAMAGNEKFLNELIWRDFYQQILWHFPHVVNGSFRPIYDNIKWRNNEAEFKAWCDGKTGYPIVDAGMRELNTTGWMHNRVRMIVASFLAKHLLIDWRWGEAYFAKKLNDFDLASNNGGWQWAAGSGVDAAPYFRIFSPKLQTEKFDKHLQYIHHWIPELNSFEYPNPIVDHDMARKRCLEVYKTGLGK